MALSANRPLPSTSTAASATISLDQQVGIESIDSDSEAVVPVAKKAKLQKKMVDEPQWIQRIQKGGS